MKLKYFIRGTGVGVLVTAFILIIAFNTQKAKISDEQIIERAKNLGMIMEEKNSIKMEEKDSSKTEEDSSKTEKESQDSNSNNQKNDPAADTSVSAPDSQRSGDTASTENTAKKVTIPEGVYSEGVANILKEEGIIEDVAGFNKFIEESGYSSFIQPGAYNLAQGQSFSDIVSAITKK